MYSTMLPYYVTLLHYDELTTAHVEVTEHVDPSANLILIIEKKIKIHLLSDFMYYFIITNRRYSQIYPVLNF